MTAMELDGGEFRLEWTEHSTFSGEILAERDLMSRVVLRKEQKRCQRRERAKA